MRRIKLTVAYDGTQYSGWQIQPNAPTVEAVLDAAIMKLTGEPVHVTGASRTDAGVHAFGNVAVFDTAATIPGARWAYALNRYLPEDVSIVESREVRLGFHPRHCDTVKTYEYQILNTPFPVPQFRNYAWHVAQPLNIEKMNRAAQCLVGEHDFKSFCCVRTQVESTVRTIYSLTVESSPFSAAVLQQDRMLHPASGCIFPQRITIRISGNGFLYNMVRIIAGTLMQVGKGQLTESDVAGMLARKDRCSAGQTAPPQGLTLLNIAYAEEKEF